MPPCHLPPAAGDAEDAADGPGLPGSGGSRDMEEGTPAAGEEPGGAADDALKAMLGAQEYHEVSPGPPLIEKGEKNP